jgi:hypothetical protein
MATRTQNQIDKENQDYRSSERNVRFKRIGLKGTENHFDSSEDDIPGDRDSKRKKTKYLGNRPSFFGLVDDQEVLKELCRLLMTENKRDNK